VALPGSRVCSDSFTDQIAQLPTQARTTGRLRQAVAVAVEAGRVDVQVKPVE
jgi:hypothetical protein